VDKKRHVSEQNGDDIVSRFQCADYAQQAVNCSFMIEGKIRRHFFVQPGKYLRGKVLEKFKASECSQPGFEASTEVASLCAPRHVRRGDASNVEAVEYDEGGRKSCLGSTLPLSQSRRIGVALRYR
jgi:hypothetical protein